VLFEMHGSMATEDSGIKSTTKSTTFCVLFVRIPMQGVFLFRIRILLQHIIRHHRYNQIAVQAAAKTIILLQPPLLLLLEAKQTTSNHHQRMEFQKNMHPHPCCCLRKRNDKDDESDDDADLQNEQKRVSRMQSRESRATDKIHNRLCRMAN